MKKKTELLKNKEINIFNNNNNNNSNQINIIKKKIKFFKNIIEKNIFHINKNKSLGIISFVYLNI